MMYTTNILALPMVLILWVLVAYADLLVLRLILHPIGRPWARRVVAGLEPITDPLVLAVGRRLSVYRKQPLPSWLAWVATMISVLVIRSVWLEIIRWIS